MALRTAAYGGVMSARVMKENQVTTEPKPIENAAAQRLDPVLAGVVEWGRG